MLVGMESAFSQFVTLKSYYKTPIISKQKKHSYMHACTYIGIYTYIEVHIIYKICTYRTNYFKEHQQLKQLLKLFPCFPQTHNTFFVSLKFFDAIQ